MERKSNPTRMPVGAISIFMIFVILIMTILAILAYLKADSYYRSSLRQVELVSDYYQCEANLLKQFKQLTVNNLEKQLEMLPVDYQIEDNYYVIIDDINSHQSLKLSFTLQDDTLKIIEMQVVNEEGANGR